MHETLSDNEVLILISSLPINGTMDDDRNRRSLGMYKEWTEFMPKELADKVVRIRDSRI